jgi:hypothetical protein
VEGLKSFAAELGCVDTTDIIFSWIEKEMLYQLHSKNNLQRVKEEPA